MYPRTNYEMTEDDLKAILDACKPVPCMMVGSYTPSSPQENANRAWAVLGEKWVRSHDRLIDRWQRESVECGSQRDRGSARRARSS